MVGNIIAVITSQVFCVVSDGCTNAVFNGTEESRREKYSLGNKFI